MTNRKPYREAVRNVVQTILALEDQYAFNGPCVPQVLEALARIRAGINIGMGWAEDGPLPFEQPPWLPDGAPLETLWAGIEIPTVPRGGIRYDVPLRVERDEPEKVYNLDDGSVVPLRNQGGKVIGVATVNDDGSVEMTVTDPEAKAALQTDLDHYSVPNPFIPESHREALRARGMIPPLGSFDEGIERLTAPMSEPGDWRPASPMFGESLTQGVAHRKPDAAVLAGILNEAGLPPVEHGGIEATVRLLVGRMRAAEAASRLTEPVEARCPHYWHNPDDRCIRSANHAPPHYFDKTGPEPDWRETANARENPDAAR